MQDTSYSNFPNQGFISATLEPNEIDPIKQEIEQIQKDFANSTVEELGNAGNLKNNFALQTSLPTLQTIVQPLCKKYCEVFAHGDRTQNKFNLKNAWVNYQSKHEYFGNHTHNGLFSFALWIKVPYTIQQEQEHVNYSNRNIQRLPAFHFHYTDALGTIRNQIIPVDKTYENKLILFPGNMNHSVSPFYTSDEYRITVSGNIE